MGISAMCQAIGMSKGTYEMLKKGMISSLNYYESNILILLWYAHRRGVSEENAWVVTAVYPV